MISRRSAVYSSIIRRASSSRDGLCGGSSLPGRRSSVRVMPRTIWPENQKGRWSRSTPARTARATRRPSRSRAGKITFHGQGGCRVWRLRETNGKPARAGASARGVRQSAAAENAYRDARRGRMGSGGAARAGSIFSKRVPRWCHQPSMEPSAPGKTTPAIDHLKSAAGSMGFLVRNLCAKRKCG